MYLPRKNCARNEGKLALRIRLGTLSLALHLQIKNCVLNSKVIKCALKFHGVHFRVYVLRILVLSFYFQPDLCAGSFRCTALVEQLLEQGAGDCQIDVISTLPNRYTTYSADALEYEKHNTLNSYIIIYFSPIIFMMMKNIVYCINVNYET